VITVLPTVDYTYSITSMYLKSLLVRPDHSIKKIFYRKDSGQLRLLSFMGKSPPLLPVTAF
jgi:hypothetical protein